MTTHLIELPLSLRSLHRWAGSRKLPDDEGLLLHHLLGETFGPAVLQPFRLMVAPRAQNGTLYAYANAAAEDLRHLARPSLTPAHAEVVVVGADHHDLRGRLRAQEPGHVVHGAALAHEVGASGDHRGVEPADVGEEPG